MYVCVYIVYLCTGIFYCDWEREHSHTSLQILKLSNHAQNMARNFQFSSQVPDESDNIGLHWELENSATGASDTDRPEYMASCMIACLLNNKHLITIKQQGNY